MQKPERAPKASPFFNRLHSLPDTILCRARPLHVKYSVLLAGQIVVIDKKLQL